MSFEFHSPKLEEYFKQYDLEKCISFMRTIFRFSYTKTRGDNGVYIWFGDNDWDMKSQCPVIDMGCCTIYFINYTEDEVINKFTRYYNLKAFI